MTAPLAAVAPASATVLLLLTAVAGLPALLAAAPEPRQRASGSAAGAETLGAETLLIVHTATDRWYVNGQPVSPQALAERLARQRQRRAQAAPPALRLRYLPSPALASGEISRRLAWLQSQSGTAVQLELAGRG